jgi:MoaA/NifB/PqqE/SkfB family radical SAM enzyme
MKNISPKLARGLFVRGVANLLMKKPLAISFEITHSCNANCSHCDKDGIIPNEKLAPPEKFDQIYRQLRPLFAQVSGGEPLLRQDYLDVVRLFRSHGTLPMIAFVSNASLMTVEKYVELKQAGVDQFSFSLDMPDERHDKNRQIPGLFKHLSEIIPRMTALGYHDIAMISVIRRENLPYLLDIANTAFRWGASLTFSSYTQLRTQSDAHSLKTTEELQLLRHQIEQLIAMRRQGAPIVNTEAVFRRMIDFFETNHIPNCRTGIRHLVVNPDGTLAPCAMHKIRFENRRALVTNFTNHNTCGACYVPLRANTEMTWSQLWNDLARDYFRKRRQRKN